MGEALEEHINYLSDRVRLERFEAAIARAVSAGDRVADVGCGFGILGLMCLKAGAGRVWGIDRTEAIEIAREATARAGFADRYNCIADSSFRVDLPEPVDLAICDHVGYFGFDYGIVRTLGDARRRFLRPGGNVIPGRIVLEVAAVSSPNCRELVEVWAKRPVPEEYRWLHDHAVNSKHSRDFAENELASAGVRLGAVDLREECPEHLSFAAALPIDRACALDGLAGWFDCELIDDVWMTNSPLAAERVNRAQAFLPFAEPLFVLADDTLEVTVALRHEEGIIAWSARVARTGQSVRQSTWSSTILGPHDRAIPAERVPRLTRAGEARRALLELVDGSRSRAEIEALLLRKWPDLYPTADAITRFARDELQRSTR